MNEICNLLSHSNPQIKTLTLKLFGQICLTNEKEIIKKGIENDVIERIIQISHSSDPHLVKECLWILGNINASGIEFADYFI